MKQLVLLLFAISFLLSNPANAGIIDWFTGNSQGAVAEARHSSGGVINREQDGRYLKDTYRKAQTRVRHSSGGTIGQTFGRYVKGTYDAVPPRVRNFAARQGVKRAAAGVGTGLLVITAPAWSTAASMTALAIGGGLLARDVYVFTSE